MKRIKLFESFQSINPIEVRDDIKTILYELEDKGYDVEFKANVNAVGTGLGAIAMIGGKNVDVDVLESSSDVAFFIIRVTLPYDKISSAYSSGSIKKDLERFVFLLRDHLDYIEPKNIRLENGGKWISIKI
jgi:hypothetical protein